MHFKRLIFSIRGSQGPFLQPVRLNEQEDQPRRPVKTCSIYAKKKLSFTPRNFKSGIDGHGNALGWYGLTLVWTNPNGVSITKIFRFP